MTGGAKGIGRMISEGFVTNGAKVYISSRDGKACEKAAAELTELGTNGYFHMSFVHGLRDRAVFSPLIISESKGSIPCLLLSEFFPVVVATCIWRKSEMRLLAFFSSLTTN